MATQINHHLKTFFIHAVPSECVCIMQLCSVLFPGVYLPRRLSSCFPVTHCKSPNICTVLRAMSPFLG